MEAKNKMNERLIFPYKTKEEQQQYYEMLHLIYSRLVDETSKEIFQSRLLMSLTGNISEIRKLVLKTEAGRSLKALLENQNRIYLYGAGIRGQRIVQMFPKMNWEGYIDREKEGTCNNIKIIKLENLKSDEAAIILITNLEGYDEIKDDLLAHGIHQDFIYTLNDFEVIAHQDQYFEERCIEYFCDHQGAFLDAGSFDGADCVKFVNSNLYHNNILYAFEPDEKNYVICKKKLEGLSNVEVFNVGLAARAKKAYFLADKGECSRITDEGDCVIDIDTIDSIIGENPIGYIKMDIEGNELEAIKGAKKHITRDKPNLMISVYHKIDDIIEIPKLLLEYNPNYKFALGHYSVCNADTVLYAF